MRGLWVGWVVAAFMLRWFVVAAQAEVPKTMAFQGRLTDQNGQLLDGTQTVTFKIYDAANAGTKLWEETQTVPVSQGLFSTLLGTVSSLDLPFDRPYWVEIQVGSEILTSRQPLSAAPYALNASRLGSIVVSSQGYVGIGTAEPPYPLTVETTGNRGIAAQLFRGQYYGTLITTRSTSPNYYVLDVRNNDTGRIGGAGTSLLIVQADGKVGVGTPSPTQRLEVDGAIRLTPHGAPRDPLAGTFYYDAATRHFFGFDGTAWKQLDN